MTSDSDPCDVEIGRNAGEMLALFPGWVRAGHRTCRPYGGSLSGAGTKRPMHDPSRLRVLVWSWGRRRGGPSPRVVSGRR